MFNVDEAHRRADLHRSDASAGAGASLVRVPVAGADPGEVRRGGAVPGLGQFISEVFPDDAEAIAWEIPGWLITPATSIHKAVLLTGDGANGKST
ncbi:MAG: hypothetical protein HY235_24370 [Acidobacteria bacterium]|nr:hypothetical protein [Acidobacteriota bacterium]